MHAVFTLCHLPVVW